jgi:hypothetical protein
MINVLTLREAAHSSREFDKGRGLESLLVSVQSATSQYYQRGNRNSGKKGPTRVSGYHYITAHATTPCLSRTRLPVIVFTSALVKSPLLHSDASTLIISPRSGCPLV